jgi:Sulfotransferase domain
MTVASTLKRLAPHDIRDRAKGVVRLATTASAGLRPPPDFLIVGTKRGGTTSLWNWLLQHPLVLPLVPAVQNLKSAHYYYWHYDRGASWYRGFFPLATTRRLAARRHGSEPVSGEASPYYLFDPRVPGRVAADLPEVRIIVLLRDPVERAYSHHRERVHEGVEDLSFRQALDAEDGRLDGELARMEREPFYYSRPHDWYSYRQRGVYAPQLRRWQEVVPPSRLVVLRSEDMYAQPQAVYDEVTTFLGLPRQALLRPERYNYHPAQGIDVDLRESLAAYYEPHNRELEDLLGRRMDWTRPGR